MSRSSKGCLILLILILTAGSAYGAVRNCKTGWIGNWSDTNSWVEGAVPGGTYEARFFNGGTATLAVAGQPRAYLHFSEPVYTDAVAPQRPIVAADFNYSDGGNTINGLTTLETIGNGAHAAMITFTNPLSADNLLLATAQTLNALAAQVFDQPYTVNPGIYANTNLDGNLNPVNKPMLATLPRVSDVRLGLIEPVFATDQVTQRDPLRGGIGRITAFDGSVFLQDLDILLQARILAATATD